MSQPSTQELEVRVAMDTDPGLKRKQNQDAIGHSIPANPEQLAQLGRLFVLADGVGGLTGGDLASQYAVSTIISSYYAQVSGDPPDRLARAIAEANNVIFSEGQEHVPPQIMATTVVAAVVRGDELVIGNVGDSPAYLMRGGHTRQLTQDHTLANQRQEEGLPLPDGDPAGHKLVRALGSQPAVKVDIITGRLRDGDIVVLCSDGLTRYMPPDEIEQVATALPPDAAVRQLIATANQRGGADNVSVIVLHMVARDEPEDEQIAGLGDRPDDELILAVDKIADPMDSWGVPRRSERIGRQAAEPDSGRPARSLRRRPPRSPKVLDEMSIPGPVRDLWRLLRGNAVITAVGAALALIFFTIVVILLITTGDDGPSTPAPSPTIISDEQLTATIAIMQTATAQEYIIQTNTALQDSQAATAAAQAIRSLTPPTPVPTYGPQMSEAMWFVVLGDEPIPTFAEPSISAAVDTPLEPENTYRVMMVNRAPALGPWYQVIDNQGLDARWVNGPSLHRRIAVVDSETGVPLPTEQQPPDIPLPDEGLPTPTPSFTPTPLPTLTGTPGTPATAVPTHTPSPTPTIAYGPDSFPINSIVVAQVNLDLCSLPSVQACSEVGSVLAGETGKVLAGPVASGEHWWWQIEFSNDRTGWVAQVLLAAQ